MKRILGVILVIFVFASFYSCGKIPAIDYMSFHSDSFELNGKLISAQSEYALNISYEKDGPITAIFTAPERISGCTIVFNSDGGAVLSFGGITVSIAQDDTSLLDYGAAAMLREMLLPSSEQLISAEVTELGGQTYNLALFSNERGELSIWFDKDGIPVRFELDGSVLAVNSFEKLGTLDRVE